MRGCRWNSSSAASTPRSSSAAKRRPGAASRHADARAVERIPHVHLDDRPAMVLVRAEHHKIIPRDAKQAVRHLPHLQCCAQAQASFRVRSPVGRHGGKRAQGKLARRERGRTSNESSATSFAAWTSSPSRRYRLQTACSCLSEEGRAEFGWIDL